MSELLTLQDVFAQLRTASKEAGGQNAWANKHGLTPASVSTIANAKRDPNEAFLRALGLRKVTRYVRVKAAQ